MVDDESGELACPLDPEFALEIGRPALNRNDEQQSSNGRLTHHLLRPAEDTVR